MEYIDCTPDWKRTYEFFLYIQKTEPKRFAKLKKKMGEDWDKLVAIATKDDK